MMRRVFLESFFARSNVSAPEIVSFSKVSLEVLFEGDFQGKVIKSDIFKKIVERLDSQDEEAQYWAIVCLIDLKTLVNFL